MAYLTPEGLEKFKKELDYLENVKRKELAERLNYAISFGDLRENAAYHEAKEAQGFLEGRIQELKTIISRAKVVETKNDGTVRVGSVVTLKTGNEVDKYTLVGPEEADVFSNKLSFKSPLGSAILGKKKGGRASVDTPRGTVDYEIVSIE